MGIALKRIGASQQERATSAPPRAKWAVLASGWIGLTALSRGAARLMQDCRARRAINDLLALDGRTLKDIGVPRCEIPYRVHHGGHHWGSTAPGARNPRTRCATNLRRGFAPASVACPERPIVREKVRTNTPRNSDLAEGAIA